MSREDPKGPPRPESNDEAEALRRARRKLLRAGVYVVPAVLGVLIAQDALAQSASCQPTVCTPCDGGCPPRFC